MVGLKLVKQVSGGEGHLRHSETADARGWWLKTVPASLMASDFGKIAAQGLHLSFLISTWRGYEKNGSRNFEALVST